MEARLGRCGNAGASGDVAGVGGSSFGGKKKLASYLAMKSVPDASERRVSTKEMLKESGDRGGYFYTPGVQRLLSA